MRPRAVLAVRGKEEIRGAYICLHKIPTRAIITEDEESSDEELELSKQDTPLCQLL